jgi:hypothetical protein
LTGATGAQGPGAISFNDTLAGNQAQGNVITIAPNGLSFERHCGYSSASFLFTSSDSTLQLAGTVSTGSGVTEVDDNKIPVASSPPYNLDDNAASFIAAGFAPNVVDVNVVAANDGVSNDFVGHGEYNTATSTCTFWGTITPAS